MLKKHPQLTFCPDNQKENRWIGHSPAYFECSIPGFGFNCSLLIMLLLKCLIIQEVYFQKLNIDFLYV